MAHLRLEWCTRILEAASEEALSAGLALSIAVTDSEGHLIALHRMDGAGWLTPDIARGKAFAAAAWKLPSREVLELLGGFPMLVAAIQMQTGGAFIPQEGGIPILMEGEVVGAIGASGGTGAQDATIVAAALRAVGAPTPA